MPRKVQREEAIPARPRSVSRSESRNDGAEDWTLRHVDDLPEWMKRSEFVLTGYRVGYTTSMAIRSFFMIHNETGNVWTHFLGFLIILVLSLHLYTDVLADVWTHHALFFVFVAANFICLLSSTTYHLLSCVSPRHYDLLVAADYFGISCLLIASFIPSIWFAFACHPGERMIYLTAVVVLGSLSLIAPLLPSRIWDTNTVLRVSVLTATGASGLIPAVHTFLAWPRTVVHVGVFFMFLFYALGICFYLSRFPERYYPGHFDIWFQSHTIWHVCVAAAAVTHFLTCLSVYQRFTSLEQACP